LTSVVYPAAERETETIDKIILFKILVKFVTLRCRYISVQMLSKDNFNSLLISIR
jgi:hypothetical protein